MYLLECDFFNVHYVGKKETTFNVRLNNHRKDVKSPNASLVNKHFTLPGHDFNKNFKFILINILTYANQIKRTF